MNSVAPCSAAEPLQRPQRLAGHGERARSRRGAVRRAGRGRSGLELERLARRPARTARSPASRRTPARLPRLLVRGHVRVLHGERRQRRRPARAERPVERLPARRRAARPTSRRRPCGATSGRARARPARPAATSSARTGSPCSRSNGRVASSLRPRRVRSRPARSARAMTSSLASRTSPAGSSSRTTTLVRRISCRATISARALASAPASSGPDSRSTSGIRYSELSATNWSRNHRRRCPSDSGSGPRLASTGTRTGAAAPPPSTWANTRSASTGANAATVGWRSTSRIRPRTPSPGTSSPMPGHDLRRDAASGRRGRRSRRSRRPRACRAAPPRSGPPSARPRSAAPPARPVDLVRHRLGQGPVVDLSVAGQRERVQGARARTAPCSRAGVAASSARTRDCGGTAAPSSATR